MYIKLIIFIYLYNKISMYKYIHIYIYIYIYVNRWLTPGDGAGEVRTHFAVCGGGGAYNMGAGGDGALRVEGALGAGKGKVTTD
jgi:hypothetical protein